jgi:recombination protein RecA
MTATAEQRAIADKTLKLVMNQINGVKGNKKPDVIKIGYLGEMKALNIPAVSSGSLALDAAMGVGGYPQGRMIEIYGPESSGKTTLCLHAIAEWQKAGYKVAFIDVEHTLDTSYAEALGVDIGSLLFSQPDDGDEAMRIVDSLVRSGQVGLIVVDSIASLVTAAEMEGEITDTHMGRQARLMSQSLKRLTVLCGKTNTNIIFTNQIRMKIGVMYGNPETTSGGNAMKFYGSIRLDIRRKEPIKLGDEVLGAVTRVKVVKNKVAKPFKQAFFNIMYGIGIDKEADTIAMAVEVGVIDRAGAWYSYGEDKIGQGLNNTITYLKERPELIEEIREKVMNILQPTEEEDESQ